jgi:hypothetical protein
VQNVPEIKVEEAGDAIKVEEARVATNKPHGHNESSVCQRNIYARSMSVPLVQVQT